MRIVFNKAKARSKRLALAEGENERIIRAARQIAEEKIAAPVLLGDRVTILAKAHDARIDLSGIEVVDPVKSAELERYTQRLFELRARKGVTRNEAEHLIRDPNYYAAVMVEMGDADAMLTGLSFHYPDALRPALQIIRTAPQWTTAAGVYMVTLRNRVLFFADTTINIDPDADKLAEIAILTARLAVHFDVEPSIAMLSYSNFGSVRDARTDKVRQAVDIVRQRAPHLEIDGEMQADTALVPELLKGTYPFSTLRRPPNVLIFPNLEAGNIGYKLVQRLGNAEVVGPIVVGLNKPAYVLQRGDEVKDIVNLAAIAAVEAQESSS
ncbi:MAG: phosphate acyltransferase [Thermoflexales bacterium]|nr:phosphate acyltransferase [Thermoflexales bacterium]